LEGADPDVAYGSHLWQPAFLAGTATFAYEVFEQLGRQAPDVVVAPLGGGTLLLGAHLGFARLRAARLIDHLPRLIGVQSAACAPLAQAFRAGEPDAIAVTAGATIAEGIRIDRPPRSRQILAAIRETGGEIVEVTDDEIRTSLHTLLGQGIFVEPTSAAAHAGLARSAAGQATGTVVLAMTGHGLKASGPIGEILGT
jgi:threonine synthase